MSRLTVSVLGSSSDSRLMTLPVDVYAPDGAILARGMTAPDSPALFELPKMRGPELDHVHVLGRLPNGAALQQVAEFRNGFSEITLRLEESPHEWLQWVTPFRSLSHLGAGSKPDAIIPRRIGKVWMTLWSLEEGRWKGKGVQTVDQERDVGMQQLVIDVPAHPHLLQIGGEEVAWRLVSLPPGGQVRVALTRSAAEGGDALEITLGRREPDNELIMSYLARGAIAEANRLAEAWNAADLMLYEKKQDPVSAAANAYLLLKSPRSHLRGLVWEENLVEWFPHMADGAIVSAALALQRKDAKESEIRSKINLALRRGLPIFAMGASVLVETMAAVHRGKSETNLFHEAYLAAQAYARARCSKGAYFAFYGKSPAEPSWAPIYGLEGEAAASPASTGSIAEAVVFARPSGGIKAGRFGGMRVALPRAPVSPEVVKELRVDTHQSSVERVAEQKMPRKRSKSSNELNLFGRTLDLGIPKLETRFLEEFSVGGAERRTSLISHEYQLQQPHIFRTPTAGKRSGKPRQTAKYWRDERLIHAVTVFDGGE